MTLTGIKTFRSLQNETSNMCATVSNYAWGVALHYLMYLSVFWERSLPELELTMHFVNNAVFNHEGNTRWLNVCVLNYSCIQNTFTQI